ncbi:hypothetical protein Bca52824_092951 [Brassica carinata]|uniref:Cytochrome P450 n=1 Tax=Brassica carinata TaxID=52824 RepID=A0A8X7TKG3_BRACI|nr:hypothetical protein Bca52824_092951 [Brassica carinata]
MKLSASVICRLGFGMSLEGSKLEITYDEVIQGIMEVLGSFAAADFFPIIGKLIDRLTGLHGKCEKVFQAMDTFFDEAIKCHLDDESIKDDIIALLLKMERGEIGLGEFQLSRNHTKGILLTVKEILKTFDVDCCSRPHMTYGARLSYNRNDLGFSPYSKYWRELRKMTVVELYTAKRVKSFGHIRQEEVASFVEFIKHSASLEKHVNLNLKFMKLSTSVICRLGFGMNLEGSKLESTYYELIQGIMEVSGSFAAADFFPIFGGVIDRLTGLHGKCEKVFKTMDTFFDEAIQHHLDDESIKDDIIALLLRWNGERLDLENFNLLETIPKEFFL